MNVNQLNHDQIEELAQNHLTEHYSEYNPDAGELEGPSYGELLEALRIVGYDTLMQEYDGTEFTPDDFLCSVGEPEPAARHYYAIYSPQGIHAPSPRDTLYRYETAKQRAEDIDRVNLQNASVTLMCAVPRAFAQKRFPRAFDRNVMVWNNWKDGDAHNIGPVWRDDDTGAQEFTGKPRNVITEAYEIREIDAWMYDDSWTYNTSYRLGSFTTTGDPARAFRRALKRLGVTFYKGKTVTEYDGDVYEIVDRKTREPLFAAIPTAQED
jgi:hypothetical protein